MQIFPSSYTVYFCVVKISCVVYVLYADKPLSGDAHFYPHHSQQQQSPEERKYENARITVPTSANAMAIHTIYELYAPSHTILSNWRCLSEFAAHNKAKQTSLCRSSAHWEQSERIECLFACLLWVVGMTPESDGADNMWAAAESCFAIMIPKRLTHTYEQRITLTHSLARSTSLRSILLSTCFGFYAVAAAS